jgi:DNA-directed RNA polymerase subunit RPC12/RpoP
VRAIACPECDETIEVDAGMEGRRVVCPECETKFTVPERGGRKRAGKGHRRPAAGPHWGLIGGIAAGVVAALAVGGAVVYKATRPKPAAAAAEAAGKPGEPPAPAGGGAFPLNPNLPVPGVRGAELAPADPPPPVPQGWAKYTMPDTNLAVYFPRNPGVPAESSSDMSVRVENRKWIIDLPGRAGGFNLDVMILPPGAVLTVEQEAVFYRLPRHQLEKLGKARFVAERPATFGAFKATEVEHVAPTGDPVVTRYGFVRSGGRQLFVIAASGGRSVPPADRKAFLDSIRPAE